MKITEHFKKSSAHARELQQCVDEKDRSGDKEVNEEDENSIYIKPHTVSAADAVVSLSSLRKRGEIRLSWNTGGREGA